MEVRKIGDGLWRWTAPHPGWNPSKGGPGGWEQLVGCVYFEALPTAVVLIDPLVPPEGTADHARFWRALDGDVERCGTSVVILLANEYHSRSAQAIHDRYANRFGASIHADVGAIAGLPCRSVRPLRGDAPLPGGIRAFPIPSLSAGEVAIFIPGHEALVFADAVLGVPGGGVRLAPESWAGESPLAKERYRREFRPTLRRLLELPVETLLVSHGEPVLSGGHRALEEALEAPGWGE